MGLFKHRREPELFERPPAPHTAAGPVEVVLHDTGPNKIQVIKLVRESTGLAGWARGGADTAENLQLLCAPCSRGKGDSIG